MENEINQYTENEQVKAVSWFKTRNYFSLEARRLDLAEEGVVYHIAGWLEVQRSTGEKLNEWFLRKISALNWANTTLKWFGYAS